MFDPAKALVSAFQNHKAGNLPEADRLCRAVLGKHPNQPDALHLLGLLAHQSGDPKSAIRLIQRAIQFHPSWPFFYESLGTVELKSGQIDEAISSYTKAIQLRPDFTDAHLHLGIAYYQQGNLDESVHSFWNAIKSNPQAAGAWNNLGVTLMDQRNYAGAVKALETALKIDPKYSDAHFNLGNVLERMDNYPASMEHLNEALRLRPDYPNVWNTLGVICHNLGDSRAIDYFRKAIRSNPDYAEAQLHLAFLLLAEGRYEEGWKQYEWRWKVPNFTSKKRDFPQPQWQGEEIKGKRLLLHAEQGHGDTIQFVRFVSMLAPYDAHLILEVQPALHRLFMEIPGIAELVSKGDPLPLFDVHCPLMSLPLILGTTLDTIPPPLQFPYIAHRPASNRAASELPLRIGLLWAGSPVFRQNHKRSIPLQQLAPWGEIPHTSFISLLKGPATSQIAEVAPQFSVLDSCSSVVDLADVAEQIMEVDLVISVCTGVAHLACTLGKPTWILLHNAADWRWLYDREDSPWYPSARLFRQKTPGDWTPVIKEVEKELSSLVRQRNAAFMPQSLPLGSAASYASAAY